MPGSRVVCAPDSFKETLSAVEAAAAMARGIEDRRPDVSVDRCPVADGGEGTLEVLAPPLLARVTTEVVCGSTGAPVRARLGICRASSTGIVELAEACGLAGIPRDRRDPMRATTYGVGQLIRAAMERGCGRIIVGLGGSATVDGGTGLAQALGVEFIDDDGLPLPHPMSGHMLQRVRRIVPAPPLPAHIDAACDVTNPLCGPSGAAAMYGPQKGATPLQVAQLDAGLRHLASLLTSDPDAPGAGAAGGAGFGLLALLGARLHRGIDLVLDAIGFADRCRGARLVISGEGRFDRQSAHGKAVLGVTARAWSVGVPTIAIVGDVEPGALDCAPAQGARLHRLISLSERFGAQAAMREAPALMARAAADVVEDELPLSRPRCPPGGTA